MEQRATPSRGVVTKLARQIESLRREAGLSREDLLVAVREERVRRHGEHLDRVTDHTAHAAGQR